MVYRLVSAPIIEAAEIVEKLSMRDDKTLRLTLFSLQKFIRVSLVCSVYFFVGVHWASGRAICERVSTERWTEGAYRRYCG